MSRRPALAAPRQADTPQGAAMIDYTFPKTKQDVGVFVNAGSDDEAVPAAEGVGDTIHADYYWAQTIQQQRRVEYVGKHAFEGVVGAEKSVKIMVEFPDSDYLPLQLFGNAISVPVCASDGIAEVTKRSRQFLRMYGDLGDFDARTLEITGEMHSLTAFMNEKNVGSTQTEVLDSSSSDEEGPAEGAASPGASNTSLSVVITTPTASTTATVSPTSLAGQYESMLASNRTMRRAQQQEDVKKFGKITTKLQRQLRELQTQEESLSSLQTSSETPSQELQRLRREIEEKTKVLHEIQSATTRFKEATTFCNAHEDKGSAVASAMQSCMVHLKPWLEWYEGKPNDTPEGFLSVARRLLGATSQAETAHYMKAQLLSQLWYTAADATLGMQDMNGGDVVAAWGGVQFVHDLLHEVGGLENIGYPGIAESPDSRMVREMVARGEIVGFENVRKVLDYDGA